MSSEFSHPAKASIYPPANQRPRHQQAALNTASVHLFKYQAGIVEFIYVEKTYQILRKIRDFLILARCMPLPSPQFSQESLIFSPLTLRTHHITTPSESSAHHVGRYTRNWRNTAYRGAGAMRISSGNADSAM
uniref:Uncharacterized protein n=1 Tax=Coccidioides posadasii RMSCC 3488 TaxID=454284 RepID=A0A0J6FAN5_COCPO|nr:hypothetical protein CPAG_02644 [Coccidioides posadasii RMSCC 3488]